MKKKKFRLVFILFLLIYRALDKSFTPTELLNYDGRNGNPIYIAVKVGIY